MEGLTHVLGREVLRAALILAGLIPVSLVLAALFVSRRSPFGAALRVTSLIVKLAVAAVVMRCASSVLAWLGFSDGSTSDTMMRGLIRLDVVSSPMLLLVCTLALVVTRYSQTYLRDEGGLQRYGRSLLLTLASVTLLVISNHLGVVIAAWLATGIGLHQLLTFYRTRRQAVIVAHKEFLLSRIADLFFFASVYLIDSDVGSLHIDVVNDFVAAKGGLTPGLHLATTLLVVGVLLKSAQLPFHGWMQQVMEAPTPVSALLHAGIVNIGGFVMIRLAPLMAHAPLAQWILLVVGLLTAIVASLVMTTRTSIKLILAWSTVAQMGFMLVQCGLGVWHLALLHLLAHSCYKAHCFLSSGGIVETWRGASLVPPPRRSITFAALATLVLAAAAVPCVLGFNLAAAHSALHAPPSLAPLALALGLSFVPTIARSLASGMRAFTISVIFVVGATLAYFALHIVFDGIAPFIASDGESPFKWKVVTGGLVFLFLVQTLLKTSRGGRIGRLLRPHLRSGLYLDEWFTRLTFRIWPPRLERASTRRVD
jgi:NAD(P)H-quinone oxidoreductase subunit 5